MRRYALLWTLVLCMTAVVTAASAARHDTTLTLTVRPSITVLYKPVNATVTGVASGPLNMKLQFQECGLYPSRFRDVLQGVAPSFPGGVWSSDSVTALANGTLRATEGPDVSNEVTVVVRALVRLVATSRGHYRASVEARQLFWKKRVRIERYDRGSTWVLLRMVALSRTDAGGYGDITAVVSRSDEFALKLPKGTKLRAVFPVPQAKPCYAGGTSEVIQT